MRGNPIGRRIPNPFSASTKQFPFLCSYSSYSTSSGGGSFGGSGGGDGGGGRGRGRGFFYPHKFDFAGIERPDSQKPEQERQEQKQQQAFNGIGRGRGKPTNPGFSAFNSSLSRDRAQFESTPAQSAAPQADVKSEPVISADDPRLPSSVLSALPGAGRGMPPKQQQQPRVPMENRHVRPPAPPKMEFGEAEGEGVRYQQRQSAGPNENRQIRQNTRNVEFTKGEGEKEGKPVQQQQMKPKQPKMSKEDAVKRAVSILSQGAGDGGGRGGGRGRGRDRRDRRDELEDEDEGFGTGLFLGDDKAGEKLGEKLGVEVMNKLVEGVEEACDNVLPCPEEDAFLDAMHTNYMIEFEPEYLMGEFDQNPDIDEKPPMPLRDMLEKVKPFIMAYEGIESQEEWEAAVEETLKNVPLLKEIVDHYSGPDRVSAKKQQEELERVAKSIPASAPPSLKRFTDRAVLSLQSNPGWGFDKKCQFMDKLVREVNQCYK